MTVGPLDILRQIVEILDELEIHYALGGSVASSFFGEPRSTVDVDVAVLLAADRANAFLERVAPEFHVPFDAARMAVDEHASFNLVDTDNGFKVDVFVLGSSLLDRRQIERRIKIPLPGATDGVWVTSPEDQILRKLDWYRAGGSLSDRQWRDVVGILRVGGDDLDQDYMSETSSEIGLGDLLAKAIEQA